LNNIEFLRYKRQFPENWNEFTKEQLTFVSSVLRCNIKREVAEILIIKKFLQFSNNVFHKIHALAIADIAKAISFIFEKKELTINLIPVIKIRRKQFYGPENACLDLTFEQFFGYAETYFILFAETGQIEHLDNLVCSLYSQKKGSFNPDFFEKNLKLLKTVNTNVKFSIFLFYTGCRDLIASKFPELFSNTKSNQSKSQFHYFELIDNLNNDTIANNDSIKKSNVYEAFVRLSTMIKKPKKTDTNS